MNDSTKAVFDTLGTLLKHDLQRDLDTHRKQIEPYLSGEIVERYYYQRGRVLNQLREDPDLDKAAELLLDKAAYAALLGRKEDGK